MIESGPPPARALPALATQQTGSCDETTSVAASESWVTGPAPITREQHRRGPLGRRPGFRTITPTRQPVARTR